MRRSSAAFLSSSRSRSLCLLAGFVLGLAACGGATHAPPLPVPPEALLVPGQRPASESPAETPAPDTPASQAATQDLTLTQLLDVHRAKSARALDGTNFLFLSDGPGTAQIFSSSTSPGATPQQISSFPDRVWDLRIAPSGQAAVFLKDQGGDENDQILWLDLASDKTKSTTSALTDSPKVKHTLPAFDDTGKRLAFTSNGRNGKDMDLYVETLPAKAGEFGKKPLLELSGSFVVAEFSGDRIVVVETRSAFDSDIWFVDAKTKTKKLLTKHKGEERWIAPKFSRDGKVLYVLTDHGREYLSVVAIDIATGKTKQVLALDHDVRTLSMPIYASPKAAAGEAEDILLGVVNADGIESLHVVALDGDRKTISDQVANVSGAISSVDLSPRGDVAFVAVERPDLPSEIFRVDIGTGKADRVTKSYHAGIDESKLVSAELISMKSSDGKNLSFFYYQNPPKEGERRPVVLWIHGGPEGQAQPTFIPTVQYLVSAGYAVAAPNVRGSTGYGKSFSHLDDIEKREDSVRDLSEIGKHLAARKDVDKARIALVGGSYGGYMVLAGLTLYPEQWAAGVDIVGIANFRTFLEQTSPYRRALREAEYGSLAKDGALLDRVSPIHKVERINVPLMVIHGTRDPRVPIGEAKQIAEALKKRGLPCELLTFEDEGHGVAKRKNQLIAYPAMVEFLNKHVKGKTP